MIEGLFIVLEGVDGAGTTTHSKRLATALSSRGLPVHATQEPSNGPIGAMLRQILQGRIVVPGLGGRPPSPATMALLFAADRMDHLEAEILPNLRDGVTVISDRYYHSSLAYQSTTGDRTDASLTWLREINRHARKPDLTIVLDVPPAIAKARRASRRNAEIYEDDDLQVEISRFYEDIERHFPDEHLVHVDSNRSMDEVAAALLAHVRKARGEA